MPITRDEALLRIDRLGATAKRPVIAPDVRTAILDQHAIPDAAGRQPDTLGWVPTWDVHGAVAEVWRSKAAAVAGDYDFTADDASFSKGDVLAHCLAMEQKFLDLSATDRVVRAGGGKASTLTVGGTNAGLTNPLDAIASTVIP